MTLAFTPGPSDPIQGPDRPFPLPYPPTGPQLRGPRPGDDDMPRPNPSPSPHPRPGPFRQSLRIGHAPRLPRRERVARVLFQAARYLVALGVVVGAASWLTTFTPEVFWLGLLFAAMVANPWRPKRPARPVRPGSARVVHSLLLRAGGRARRGPLSPLPLG